MCGGAKVLNHVRVHHANSDLIDAEHLWVSDQGGLEALRELGLRIGRLWQRVDVVNLASRGHDNKLGLHAQLSKLTLDILHHLGEDVLKVEEFDLT